jgi:branched-chain amino acid transport system ATP-binding protein
MNAIDLINIHKNFGNFKAVEGLDLHIPQQQRCALLGPNGAGKTTLLNLISGRLSLTQGVIRIEGHDVSREPAERRAHLGVGRSFQKTNIFPQLTLLENVRLGLQAKHLKRNWNPWMPIDGDKAINDEASALLQRVKINRSVTTRADALSYG